MLAKGFRLCSASMINPPTLACILADSLMGSNSSIFGGHTLSLSKGSALPDFLTAYLFASSSILTLLF